MKCVKCGDKVKCEPLKTRSSLNGTIIRRVYKCLKCNIQFKSFELSDIDLADYVEDTEEINNEIVSDRGKQYRMKSYTNEWLKNK